MALLKTKAPQMEIEHLVIYTDGGARGNPGPAGIGAVFYVEDEFGKRREIKTIQKFIGASTNNFAEYTALISALEFAKGLPYALVQCYLDSELVVKQLNGLYKVREESLKLLAAKVLALRNNFENVSFIHIHREKNTVADKLVNLAIDAALEKH